MAKIPEECKCPMVFIEAERLGLSDADLCRLIPVSSGNISQWRSGRSAPRGQRWARLSEILGKPVAYLKQEKPATVAGSGLSEMEIEAVNLLHALPEAEQRALLELMRARVNAQ